MANLRVTRGPNFKSLMKKRKLALRQKEQQKVKAAKLQRKQQNQVKDLMAAIRKRRKHVETVTPAH